MSNADRPATKDEIEDSLKTIARLFHNYPDLKKLVLDEMPLKEEEKELLSSLENFYEPNEKKSEQD